VQPVDIKELVSNLALPDSGPTPDAIEHHLQEILRWNPRIGLVSKRDTLAVLERLVRQSVQLHELVVPRTEAACGKELHVVDVGSGGGFPGLVWAAMEPDWRFLLVERRHKKGVFLERMVKVLGLEDVEVFVGRAEEAQLVSRFVERFDVATAMAVGPPAKTAGLVEGFLRSGRVFATTVPRDEPGPPQSVGSRFTLLETDTYDETLFAIYQKR
jgi:16S rRNA (guanine(527)-N(7))-methyltransferase RsmG